MSKSAAFGVAAGLGAAVLVCLAAWLSPLAERDRFALALLAVTISVPVGAMAASGASTASAVAARGIAAGAALATGLTLLSPSLWLHAVSWCAAGALLGAALSSFGRVPALMVALLWLALGGLPFYFDSAPVLRETAANWALTGCPWLGFSHVAIGGDPLRRPLIYLGQLSALTDQPVFGVLTAGKLWLAAGLAWFGCALNQPSKSSSLTQGSDSAARTDSSPGPAKSASARAQ